MAQPNPEHVQNLVEFGLGLSYDQAALLLRKHNGNADQAVSDWFDNGAGALRWQPPTAEWTQMDNVPSFNIDATDTANSSVRGAVSRPPSRASYRPNESDIVDLSGAHAAADASKSLSMQEQQDAQDADLQRALALSRQGLDSQQENGITGLGQQFGPAPADKAYDMGQWQMTHAPQFTARDVVEHPRPSKRRRITGEPAFLRGSAETRYLGPLLTIYHSIPLAREALLFPPMQVHAYGNDPTWWSGTSDENYKSASVLNTGSSAENDNVLCELQTLMVFLDATNRAYGSVDALADLRGYKSHVTPDNFTRLFDVWKTISMSHSPDDPLTQVFTSEARKESSHPNMEQMTRAFHCLDPPVVPQNDTDRTLYNVLDMAIWDDEASDSLGDVWLHHCSDVLTLRLYDPSNTQRDGREAGLSVRIPAILYTDRYLEECRPISWERRTKLREYYKQVNRLTVQQEKFKTVTLPGRGPANVSFVLTAAKEAAAVAMKRSSFQTTGQHDEVETEPLLEGMSHAQIQSCISELQGVMDRLERKIERLEDQKDEIREQARRSSNWLTTPPRAAGDRPHHKYYLSGVSTKPWITYVRVRREKDLIEFDDEDQDEEEASRSSTSESPDLETDFDWWRISFSRDDVPISDNTIPDPNKKISAHHPPMLGPMTQQQAVASDMAQKVRPSNGSPDIVGHSIRRIREYEVLKAAKEEGNEVVCVYASETALKFRGSELTESQKQWIDRDNLAFEGELRIERREEQRQQRQQVEPSQESVDVDIAEGTMAEFVDVSLDPVEQRHQTTGEDAEPPHNQSHGSSGPKPHTAITGQSREMTPMSITVSSPKRESESDLEGDSSSPKRPRSSSSDLLVGGSDGGVQTPTVGARSEAAAVDDSEDDQPPPYDQGRNREFPVFSDNKQPQGADHNGPEMQERNATVSRSRTNPFLSSSRGKIAGSGSKIGHHAERMFDKYGSGDMDNGVAASSLPDRRGPAAEMDVESEDSEPETVHIEHSMQPMR